MNTTLKLRKQFSLSLLTVFLTSCLTNVENQLIEEEPVDDPCATITYAIHVKPIIDNNCIQCHGNGGNFPNLTTYNGTSANANIVNAEVSSGRMPRGGSLTADEKKAIDCWVEGGALNN